MSSYRLCLTSKQRFLHFYNSYYYHYYYKGGKITLQRVVLDIIIVVVVVVVRYLPESVAYRADFLHSSDNFGYTS